MSGYGSSIELRATGAQIVKGFSAGIMPVRAGNSIFALSTRIPAAVSRRYFLGGGGAWRVYGWTPS